MPGASQSLAPLRPLPRRPLPLRSRRGAQMLMPSSTSALDGHGDPLSTLPTWASAPTLLANRFHANSDRP